MELRHLRYFVATVDEGTATAAALRLHVTQPALTRQLRQLERDLGVQLFDRRDRRLTLNRTGRELLPAARAVLTAAERLRASAAFHADGGVRHLTIAAPTVTLTEVVSPFVATMATDDPVVDVRSADGESCAVVLEDGADLAIGTRHPPAPYASCDLAVLPVWAYVPANDPWSGRRRVPLTELLDRQVIGLPVSSTAREALDAAATRLGVSCPTLVEVANGTIAQALAAAGRGVAVVTDDPRFGLVPLEIDLGGALLSIPLIAAWDSRSVAAPSVAAIAERIGAWIRRAYPMRRH